MGQGWVGMRERTHRVLCRVARHIWVICALAKWLASAGCHMCAHTDSPTSRPLAHAFACQKITVSGRLSIPSVTPTCHNTFPHVHTPHALLLRMFPDAFGHALEKSCPGVRSDLTCALFTPMFSFGACMGRSMISPSECKQKASVGSHDVRTIIGFSVRHRLPKKVPKAASCPIGAMRCRSGEEPMLRFELLHRILGQTW
jgi:hypothetical protein